MTREQASAELIGWLYMMMVDGVPIHSAKRKALIVALEALQDNHGTWKFIDHLWQCSNCGKWIAIDDTHSQCMECGAIFCIISSNEWEVNYCPNCGARVEVEEE